MDKNNKNRLRAILLLSVVTVILLGSLFATHFIEMVLSYSPVSSSVILPSIKSERYYGTSKNDTLVDGFFVGNDTYIFYNNEHGVMEKVGENNKSTTFEGQIEKVVLAKNGFVLAIKNEEKISIQSVGFDGVPTYFYTINLSSAILQYLDYDGNICFAVQHKGDYDYVLSYYKLDDQLKETYKRDIYSLYNLSTVAVYPLSNKTIIFFNATYGSVKRGGYTILDNLSLSMTTEYFSTLSDYILTDAKPYGNGFIISALEKNLPRIVMLDNSFNETKIGLSESESDNLAIYTSATSCYIADTTLNKTTLYTLNDMTIECESDFADKIYDCIFVDGVAIFAIKKQNATYILHLKTGIITPIINSNPTLLKLKNNKRLCFFACIPSSSFADISNLDIYYASLL